MTKIAQVYLTPIRGGKPTHDMTRRPKFPPVLKAALTGQMMSPAAKNSRKKEAHPIAAPFPGLSRSEEG
ncbi:hypothetical protein TNIN_48181 [Trichonephila inaurata madagascariensis]|uniref:Uncharacterized protein n=1 Tax=Trichonephila inaurata madagascariensis TaxID=2747483 RepID=A0A8X6YH27_9ARAC|nr:hypothetical protein TNIN_48181 [Trichonephila inaurata madagascariensis]